MKPLAFECCQVWQLFFASEFVFATLLVGTFVRPLGSFASVFFFTVGIVFCAHVGCAFGFHPPKRKLTAVQLRILKHFLIKSHIGHVYNFFILNFMSGYN